MTDEPAPTAGRRSVESNEPAEVVEQFARKLDQAADELERLSETTRRETLDRSWIAKNVFYMFSAAVLITELIYVVEAWRGGDWTQLTPQTTELLRSVVVPVVTLILGYYFGRLRAHMTPICIGI